MAEDPDGPEASRPNIRLTAPTFRQGASDTGVANPVHLLRRRPSKHVQIEETVSPRLSSSSNIYLGSYGKNPRLSQASLENSSPGSHGTTPRNSVPPSPRASISHIQLAPLLQDVDVETDTYDLEELRDGFFDASFYRPIEWDRDDMREKAFETLPVSFQSQPSSFFQSLLQQWRDLVGFLKDISTTRSGVKLAKSFLGFFIAYVVCLIPASRDWLGKYYYMIAISTIVNHPGRSVGSQIDGAVLTIAGTAAGLGWGSLALYVSTSTVAARSGYGGVLATFLILFTITIGWLRCVFMRFYQAVICAGIAIFYTCLAGTSQAVGWQKIFHFGVPWVLGQAISMTVCVVFLPAAGTRPLALSFHTSFQVILDALQLPCLDRKLLRRKLAWNSVHVSQAIRDFTIDMSVSRFDPDDVRFVRNLIQGVIRGVLAIKPDAVLFEALEASGAGSSAIHGRIPNEADLRISMGARLGPVQLISDVLGGPTRNMIEAMRDVIICVDAVLMEISGHRKYLGPPTNVSTDISETLGRLTSSMERFDKALDSLVGRPEIPPTYSDHPEIVELFLFVHPVRQAADSVLALSGKAMEMQQKNRRMKIRLPSYPWVKSLLRSNAQVRHDRGGLTAGFYFRSQRQLDKTMQDLQSKDFVPSRRNHESCAAAGTPNMQPSSTDRYEEGNQVPPEKHEQTPERRTLRYRIWTILHRFQDFESRFAFKVTLVATLLSIPAWLPQSRGWYNDNESWWAVVAVWIMMHPRVSGNFRDLAIRTLCVIVGSVWGGLAYAAGDGNPYVMAVFAALFMIPMLYRFTQSSHPRSGFIGCISFTVVSLNAYTIDPKSSIVEIAWTRGLALVVGVVSAVLVNWILWPFVARNELRESISTMMLHSAILYRGIVAKYIYYTEGDEPGQEDIARSEMLEGRLREGFVRIRQLMELTRHEIRVRASFDPLPYSALIDACEQLFEHLVEVRQSSLYFQPHMLAGGGKATEALFSLRRDAVATVLMNLYILAGALRSNRPVPRYLPSAAAARRRLLDRMEQLEAEQAGKESAPKVGKGVRWADVYHYAYSSALTDIVEQVQRLQYYTKEITGESGFDPAGQPL